LWGWCDVYSYAISVAHEVQSGDNANSAWLEIRLGLILAISQQAVFLYFVINMPYEA
jgi:hypothetical protein